MDLVMQGYRLGQLDFLTLLTAQRTYFQASLDYIQALQWSREIHVPQTLEGAFARGARETHTSRVAHRTSRCSSAWAACSRTARAASRSR